MKKSRKSLLVRLPFSLWDDLNLGEKSGETITDDAAETGTAEGTPDPSAANTRRGLRDRKPAQQRPYYHDAQVFEDVETEPDQDLSDSPLISRSPSPELLQSKPKHFKGKGRAWKKEGSDEDEEFVTPKEKKAAKAARLKAEKDRARSENGKVDASEGDITSALWEALTSETPGSVKSKDKEHDQARKINGSLSEPPKQKKKIGRPKKSSLAGDVVRDGLDNGTPTQPPRRGRGRPRKSALSSELVRDESDDDEAPAAAETQPPLPKVVEHPTLNDLAPSSTKTSSRPSTATSTAPASTPKKRGRPRKTELNTTPVQQPSSKAAEEDPKPVVQPTSSTATDAADPKPARTRPSISSAPDKPSTDEPLPPPAAAPAAVPAAAPAAAADAAFPAPAANRGAALVESLYPCDHRVQSGSSRASSAATPVPATTSTSTATATNPPPTTTTTAPAPAAASTRPHMFAFAAAAASLAAAAAATVDELNALSDSESQSESESESDAELTVPDWAEESESFSSPRGESIVLDWEVERDSEGRAVSTPAREEREREGEEREEEIKEEEGEEGGMGDGMEEEEEGELSAAMSLSDESEL